MSKKIWLFVIIGVILSISIFAAGSYSYLSEYGPAIVNWGSNVKYGGTLKVMDGIGQLEFSMNPFMSNESTLPTDYMYEPLFFVNENGDITNFLGTSYKWTDGNMKLDITIRQGVKWSDGTPFTPQDVVFTFNYLKTYPGIDLNAIWSPANDLESVSASKDTVVFKFSKPDMNIFQYIAEEPIVPEHIWSQIKDPTTYTNLNPVGTGPFLFKSFNSALNEVTYVKNPNYWMPGRPYVNKVVFYSSAVVIMNMIKHVYDASNAYMPNIKKLYVSVDPTTNKYWFPVIQGVYLVLNDTKYPFNIPDFRKAISMALNRKFIVDSTYLEELPNYANPTMISYPQRSWLDPTLTALASSLIAYNPQEAQELLASIGFKKNSQGLLTGPDGKVLPTFTLSAVAGFTDWIQAETIMAQELKEIGIKVNPIQQSYGLYYSSLQTGTFDMSLWWVSGGINPYNAYYSAFSPTMAAPIGKDAISNFERYTNPLITDALQVFNSSSNPRLQKQAIYTIERIVLDDLPVIMVLPSTTWEVYQTSTLTGFPNAQVPYYIGEASSEILTLNVHLK